MVTDDQNPIGPQVDYAMARRMARRPDDLEVAIADPDDVAVGDIHVRLRGRIVQPRAHPARLQPVGRKALDRKAVANEKLTRLGPLQRRRSLVAEHPIDALE